MLVQYPLTVRSKVGSEDHLVGLEVDASIERCRRVDGARLAARSAWLRQLPARRHRHSDLAPCVPVDRDGRDTRGGAPRACEGVLEGVGRDVGDLSGRSQRRGEGRAQDEEVQGLVLQQLIEDQRAPDLRCQDLFEVLFGASLDQPAVGQTGGMNGSVDGAELLPYFVHDRAHVGRVADVRAHDPHLGARRLERLDSADPLADGVPRIVLREPRAPALPRRKRRSADEDQPRPCGFREILGHGEADPSQPARDQVDAALSEYGVGRLHRRQARRLEGLCKAVIAAIGDHGIASSREKLLHQLIEQTALSQAPGWGRDDVDASAPQLRVLPRDDSTRPQQGGLLRGGGALSCNLLDAV